MRRFVVLAVAAAVVATAGSAWAFFTPDATVGSSGRAEAGTLPVGNAPTLSLDGGSVTVSWRQNDPGFLGEPLGSSAAGGYKIARYSEGGVSAVTGSCAGVQRGSAETLTCTDSSVPSGRWRYTVTPLYANWTGTESDASATVVVPPAAPLSVTLANGLGQGGAYVNGSNAQSVSVDVALPTTSLVNDTVRLTVSDGSRSVTATATPPLEGATTAHFTQLDLGGLADRALTFTATSTNSYGDTSVGTSSSYTKDTSAPVVKVVADRGADHSGWFNHAVTFTTSGTDATSEIASCDSTVSYAGPDGTGLTESGTCTDKAGNTGTGTSASFDYDATMPTVAVSPSRSPDVAGWYNHAVTLTPSGTDATAGIASCQAAVVYGAPDGSPLAVTRTCTDNAGNTGTGTFTFDFDATPPTVTVSPSRPPDANGWYDAPVTWTASGTDATSGIVSCQSLAYTEGDTAGVQAGGSCTDGAGNTGIGLSPIFKYDATGPVVSAAVVNTTTNLSGSLAPDGGFIVYADASDAVSGVDATSLTADVSTLGGAAAVPLTYDAAGFTVANPDGTTSIYHYRSDPLAVQTPLADGTVTFAVGASDVAGNKTTRTASVAVDDTAPTATVTLAPDQASSTNAQPIAFVATFSEPVTGLAPNGAGIELDGSAVAAGATVAVTKIDATHFGIAVSNLAGPGTVSVTVSNGAGTDLAGNPNPASVTGPSVTLMP